MYEIKKYPNNYIEHLQYVNRLKRTQQLRELQRNEKIIQREQGFQLNFSGANGNRVIEYRKREEKDRTKSPEYVRNGANLHERVRKRWGEPVVPLLLQSNPSESDIQNASKPLQDPENSLKVTSSQPLSKISSIPVERSSLNLPIKSVANFPEVSKKSPSHIIPISLPISQRPKSSSSILALTGSPILLPQTSKKQVSESTQIADRIEKLNFEKRKRILNLLFDLENDNFNMSCNDEEVKLNES